MNASHVCFVDFDYPVGCDTWSILDVVARVLDARGVSAILACVDSAFADVTPCDVVLGVADTVAGSSFVYGPTYNSSGIGAIVPATRANENGWSFLDPFTWSVWLVFVACAIVAFCTQLMVRWLDFRRKQTSPNFVIDEDEEHAADVVMTSFTALIGSTRLYKRYDGPSFRHASSMVMALFSVFFVSLYSSNLTAFLFPSTQAFLAPSMTFFVSRDVFRVVQLPPGSIEVAVGSARERPAGAAFVAPVAWLGTACTAGSFVPLDGFVTYSVLFKYPDDVSAIDITNALANESWPAPACVANQTATSRLGVVDVWGVFAFAGVLYAGTLALRWFGKKSNRFVLVKKTPEIAETDNALVTDVSLRRRMSEDVDMFGVLDYQGCPPSGRVIQVYTSPPGCTEPSTETVTVSSCTDMSNTPNALTSP